MHPEHQSLEAFCNRILRIGLVSKWDNHLTEPLHKSTAVFARLYVQHADKSAVEAAAKELEAALTVCGTARLETLAAVSDLIDELYDLVEAYRQ